jgi:hypothetical protein
LQARKLGQSFIGMVDAPPSFRGRGKEGVIAGATLQMLPSGPWPIARPGGITQPVYKASP